MGAAWAAETKARTEQASRRIGRVFDGKRNSAAVAANVRAVQAALDGLHIGLSIFDGALRLVACNRTYLTILDFPVALDTGRAKGRGSGGRNVWISGGHGR